MHSHPVLCLKIPNLTFVGIRHQTNNFTILLRSRSLLNNVRMITIGT
jgi:hypothetical protein